MNVGLTREHRDQFNWIKWQALGVNQQECQLGQMKFILKPQRLKKWQDFWVSGWKDLSISFIFCLF